MPAGSGYPAIVVLIVLATLAPAFIVARRAPKARWLLGYLAGFGCGALVVVAERYLLNNVTWDDVIFVLLLPGVGIALAAIWPGVSTRRRRARQVSAAVLLLLAVAIVYDLVSLQPESVSVPFTAGRKGSVVEVHFKVPKTYSYSFFLNLYFKEGDAQARERVHRLAGTGAYDANRRPVDTGLAIPVRLIVERIGNDESRVVLDREFSNHERSGYGFDHYSKRIIRVPLASGRYRVRIESLADVPELEDIPVRFAVGIPGNE